MSLHRFVPISLILLGFVAGALVAVGCGSSGPPVAWAHGRSMRAQWSVQQFDTERVIAAGASGVFGNALFTPDDPGTAVLYILAEGRYQTDADGGEIQVQMIDNGLTIGFGRTIALSGIERRFYILAPLEAASSSGGVIAYPDLSSYSLRIVGFAPATESLRILSGSIRILTLDQVATEIDPT